MRKKQLVEQLAALKLKREAELNRLTLAAAGTDPVSPDEVNALTKLEADIKAREEELAGIEKVEELARANAAREAAAKKPAQSGARAHDLAEDQPYATIGELLQDIARGPDPDRVASLGEVPARLRQHFRSPNVESLAPTGSNVTVPSEGGYAIGKTFGDLIIRRVFDTGTIAGQCPPPLPLDATGKIELPVLAENSRATGSRWGGVQVYRTSEAETVTATKPKIEGWKAEVAKLMGLWYATEEQLRNAPLMTQLAGEAIPSEMAWTIDSEIWGGNGVGRCQGVTNSPAKIAVAKETSQTAATVNLTNLTKMYNRMPARLISNAAWFINQEVFPQLQLLALATGSNSGAAAYLPPGGLSVAPYGTLFGRPVIVVEHAEALGSEGDIAFLNLRDTYRLVQQGGIEAAESIHVRFIYHERAFRWTWFISGKPTWTQALSPLKGSATMSPYVLLAVRA